METGKDRRIEELSSAGLGRLLFKYSWPALTAMTLNALYAVVDRIFIGRGCGVDAMAGITLVMPIMMLFGAFGVFVGAGHSAALSIKLGEGDRASCEKLLGQLVAFKLAFCCIRPPLIFLNADTVLGWCGADKTTPEAFACAKEYLCIVVVSCLFSHLAFGLSAMQRAEGSPMSSMMCMVIGFGLNIALDPVFIFLFGMGVAGAAVATIAGQAVSFICSAVYLLRHREQFGFDFKAESFRIDPERFKTLVKLGIPFALNNAAVTISMLFVNKFINQYGVVASATFATGTKIEQIPWIVGAGVMMGCTTMIGQNMGAGKVDRMKKTVRVGVVLCAITAVVFIALFRLFPRQIYQLFMAKSSDNYEEVLDMAPLFLKALSFALPATCLMCPYHAFASGIGNATLVMITALLDGFVSRIVISLLLAKVFGLGLYGWFLGYGLAAYVNTIICMIYYYSGVWKKRKAVFESFSK